MKARSKLVPLYSRGEARVPPRLANSTFFAKPQSGASWFSPSQPYQDTESSDSWSHIGL